jgi:hypothetical protein
MWPAVSGCITLVCRTYLLSFRTSNGSRLICSLSVLSKGTWDHFPCDVISVMCVIFIRGTYLPPYCLRFDIPRTARLGSLSSIPDWLYMRTVVALFALERVPRCVCENRGAVREHRGRGTSAVESSYQVTTSRHVTVDISVCVTV